MATQILDWLWLGDQNDAFNAQKFGFTHVISCVSTTDMKLIHDMWKMHEYRPNMLHVCIDDTYSTNIIKHYKGIINWIRKIDLTKAKVLIHCQAGINRSASFAVMLYCNYMDKSPNIAIQYINSKRPGILTNMSFRMQIKTWGLVMHNYR